MLKRAKVVMLPANEKAPSNILLWEIRNKLTYLETETTTRECKSGFPQHLYTTSDDEIKEGDWYIDDTSTVRQSFTSDKDYWSVRTDYKKIITTTDSSLKIEIFGLGETAMCSLPEPSQSFIQKYVEEYNKGNIITDVLVECEEYAVGSYGMSDGEPTMDIRLKVNPKDNTITIKKVKDSWNREEVISLIRKFSDYADNQIDHQGINNACCSIGSCGWDEDEWIEENL